MYCIIGAFGYHIIYMAVGKPKIALTPLPSYALCSHFKESLIRDLNLCFFHKSVSPMTLNTLEEPFRFFKWKFATLFE
jgi:hypothetical protein